MLGQYQFCRIFPSLLNLALPLFTTYIVLNQTKLPKFFKNFGRAQENRKFNKQQKTTHKYSTSHANDSKHTLRYENKNNYGIKAPIA